MDVCVKGRGKGNSGLRDNGKDLDACEEKEKKREEEEKKREEKWRGRSRGPNPNGMEGHFYLWVSYRHGHR